MSQPQDPYRPRRATSEPNSEHAQYSPTRAQAAGQAKAGVASRPKTGRRILIIVVAILAILALGVAAFFLIDQNNQRKDRDASAAAIGTFLDDVSAGRATDALTQVDTSHIELSAQPLLSDAVLAASVQKAPITFEAPVLLDSSTQQRHEYQFSAHLGQQSEQITAVLTKNSAGVWRINPNTVLSAITIKDGHPKTINGVSTDGLTTAIVFPGSYQVATGSKLVSYPEENSTRVFLAPQQTGLTLPLKLADGVADQIKRQADALLQACTADKSVPGPCNWPLDFGNGKAVSGSVIWVLNPANPAVDAMNVSDTVDPSLVQTYSLTYNTVASGDGVLNDGSKGSFQDVSLQRTTRFTVDLRGDQVRVKIG